MLINANTLKDCRLDCTDGQIGKVKEFYFGDHYWTIRNLIVDTGSVTSLPTRDYEDRLHRHYDRKEYWADEPVRTSVVDTTVAHAK